MKIKQNNAISVSVATIWISIVLISVFAPEMITGSQQEHLPIIAITGWIWGLLATGLVACLIFVKNKQNDQSDWTTFLIATVSIWTAVTLVSLLFPPFITGTDPTQIPLAGMLAPVVGTIATAFACIFTAIKFSQR